MAGIDRYEAVGLTGNPFIAPLEYGTSVAPVDELFVSRDIPLPPLPGSRTLFQVLGDKGFGKSTHLEWWRAQNPGPLHYIPLKPYTERWARPPLVRANFHQAIVYGDEIDRMPKPLRAKWFRHLAQRGATLVIGTHVDLGALAKRSGFEVMTHTLRPLDRPTLSKIIDRRLAAFATTAGTRIEFTNAEVDQVLTESEGNPREAETICHAMLAAKVAG